jgi:hypothetical protein
MKRVNITDTETVVLKNDLKALRDQAHTYFDMLWQLQYVIGRNQAYEYLNMGLGIKDKVSNMTNKDGKIVTKSWHMGRFSKHRCRLAVIWSISMLNSLRVIDIEEGREPRFPKYIIKLNKEGICPSDFTNKNAEIPQLVQLIKQINTIICWQDFDADEYTISSFPCTVRLIDFDEIPEDIKAQNLHKAKGKAVVIRG